MRPFEYAAPSTKEQAISLLGSRWEDAAILAGGTDLLSTLKDDLFAPRRVVDIKGIQELAEIESNGQAGLRIGALATMEQLREHPEIRRDYPSLAQAAEGVTSTQIRSRGTVGGDLCQRPRCWYFRSGFGLLAKDKSGRSLAPEGENRYHAILGNEGSAYFVNPSSLAPALMALGARVRLFGPQGRRELLLDQFFMIPKTGAERENVLRPNEMLMEVVVPAGKWQSATYEVRQKEALDWPLVVAAVALQLNGGQVGNARVVLGHVAPIPWRSPEAERSLIGKPITEQTALEAGKAAVKGARPLSQNAYKVQLARVAVKRALLKAARGGA